MEILIVDGRGERELRQDVEDGQGCRVRQDRQRDQILDRARPELRPDAVVFASRVLSA